MPEAIKQRPIDNYADYLNKGSRYNIDSAYALHNQKISYLVAKDFGCTDDDYNYATACLLNLLNNKSEGVNL